MDAFELLKADHKGSQNFSICWKPRPARENLMSSGALRAS
jgi:hypothetical protein